MFGLLLIALSLPSPVQTVPAQIEKYVAPFAERKDFSGVVWVRQEGKTVYRKVVGMANVEWGVRHSFDSRFRIASLTKTFTSGAIYVLEKQGKLSFEDRLSKYIPTLPNADKITIRMLLGHLSGLGSPDMEPHSHRGIGLDEVIALIAKEPPSFEPGAKNQYSNSGYTVLAKIIEIVSGKPYDAFLRQTFFEPLGMKHTGNYGPDEVIPRRTEAYVPGPPPSGVSPVNGYDEYPYLGSGSLWSNVEDLGKWLDAVEVNRFYDIDKLDWPMGWGKRTYFGHRANEQTGLSTGFASGMIDFPSKRLQVIVLSNIQTQFAGAAVKDIAGIVLGQPPVSIPVPQFVDASRVDSETVLGTYELGKDKLEVFRKGNSYYYHWNGGSDVQYLAPLGEKSLYARNEFAVWTWPDRGHFVWESRFGKMELKRVTESTRDRGPLQNRSGRAPDTRGWFVPRLSGWIVMKEASPNARIEPSTEQADLL